MLFGTYRAILCLITLIQTPITDLNTTCFIIIAVHTVFSFIVRNAAWANGPVIERGHAWFFEGHLHYFILIISSDGFDFVRDIGVLPQRLNVKKWKNIVCCSLVLFFFSINKFLYVGYYHVYTVIIRSWDIIWYKLLICTCFDCLFV